MHDRSDEGEVAVAPQVREVDVLGMPLPWLFLGVLAYPAIALAAWGYVRAAERAT